MGLPFTEAAFLDVFGAYNVALWPVVAVLWIVTLAFTLALVRGRADSVALSALAALHWLWAGAVYHAVFFTRINPAAWFFATVFIAEALLFVWYGVWRKQLAFAWAWTPRHAASALFLAYSLAYPLLVVLSGHAYPRAPIFAVPCPTTLFTAGLLLAATPPVPLWLSIVPIAWSLVAGSAALLLGIAPDLMLFASAVALAAGLTHGSHARHNQPA